MNKYMIFVTVMIGGCARLYGAWTNVEWIRHPVTDPVLLQQIQTQVVTTGMQEYSGIVFNWIFVPFLLVYIAFFLFSKAVRLKEEV